MKAAVRQTLRVKNRAYVNELLSRSGCDRCGETDPRVLQFHHNNPKEKVSEVSNLVSRGFSLKAVKAEIAKCTILCANCHAILHHEERMVAKAKKEERHARGNRAAAEVHGGASPASARAANTTASPGE